MLELAGSILKVVFFLIFLISSVPKLANIKKFVDGVIEYRVVPRKLSVMYGYTLPVIELFASILIIFHSSSFYGFMMTLLLLVSFLIADIMVIKSKRSVTCSCFGNFLESQVDIFSLYRNGALIVLNVLAIGVTWFQHSIYSAASLVLGIVIVFIYFLSQKIWNDYKKNMKLLKA